MGDGPHRSSHGNGTTVGAEPASPSRPKPRTDLQRDIIDRLERGERLVGPVTVRHRCLAPRLWGYLDGEPRYSHYGPLVNVTANGTAVRSLAARGDITIHHLDTGRREARLAGRANEKGKPA